MRTAATSSSPQSKPHPQQRVAAGHNLPALQSPAFRFHDVYQQDDAATRTTMTTQPAGHAPSQSFMTKSIYSTSSSDTATARAKGPTITGFARSGKDIVRTRAALLGVTPRTPSEARSDDRALTATLTSLTTYPQRVILNGAGGIDDNYADTAVQVVAEDDSCSVATYNDLRAPSRWPRYYARHDEAAIGAKAMTDATICTRDASSGILAATGNGTALQYVDFAMSPLALHASIATARATSTAPCNTSALHGQIGVNLPNAVAYTVASLSPTELTAAVPAFVNTTTVLATDNVPCTSSQGGRALELVAREYVPMRYTDAPVMVTSDTRFVQLPTSREGSMDCNTLQANQKHLVHVSATAESVMQTQSCTRFEALMAPRVRSIDDDVNDLLLQASMASCHEISTADRSHTHSFSNQGYESCTDTTVTPHHLEKCEFVAGNLSSRIGFETVIDRLDSMGSTCRDLVPEQQGPKVALLPDARPLDWNPSSVSTQHTSQHNNQGVNNISTLASKAQLAARFGCAPGDERQPELQSGSRSRIHDCGMCTRCTANSQRANDDVPSHDALLERIKQLEHGKAADAARIVELLSVAESMMGAMEYAIDVPSSYTAPGACTKLRDVAESHAAALGEEMHDDLSIPSPRSLLRLVVVCPCVRIVIAGTGRNHASAVGDLADGTCAAIEVNAIIPVAAIVDGLERDVLPRYCGIRSAARNRVSENAADLCLSRCTADGSARGDARDAAKNNFLSDDVDDRNIVSRLTTDVATALRERWGLAVR